MLFVNWDSLSGGQLVFATLFCGCNIADKKIAVNNLTH